MFADLILKKKFKLDLQKNKIINKTYSGEAATTGCHPRITSHPSHATQTMD